MKSLLCKWFNIPYSPRLLRFETAQGPRYKLTDFGCVTPFDCKGPFHRIDSGHYRYAPPEITRVDPEDHYQDISSLYQDLTKILGNTVTASLSA